MIKNKKNIFNVHLCFYLFWSSPLSFEDHIFILYHIPSFQRTSCDFFLFPLVFDNKFFKLLFVLQSGYCGYCFGRCFHGVNDSGLTGFFQLFFFSTLKTLLYCLLTCIASDKKLAVIPILIPQCVKVLFSPRWLKAYTFNKRKIWENRECSMSAPNRSWSLLAHQHHWKGSLHSPPLCLMFTMGTWWKPMKNHIHEQKSPCLSDFQLF